MCREESARFRKGRDFELSRSFSAHHPTSIPFLEESESGIAVSKARIDARLVF